MAMIATTVSSSIRVNPVAASLFIRSSPGMADLPAPARGHAAGAIRRKISICDQLAPRHAPAGGAQAYHGGCVATTRACRERVGEQGAGRGDQRTARAEDL